MMTCNWQVYRVMWSGFRKILTVRTRLCASSSCSIILTLFWQLRDHRFPNPHQVRNFVRDFCPTFSSSELSSMSTLAIRQARQSGFKSVVAVDPGLKTERSLVLKVHQMEVHSTWLIVSSPEFLRNYAQIIPFLKSHHFGTCFYLVFLYIIGPPNSKVWGGRDYPIHPIIDAR